MIGLSKKSIYQGGVKMKKFTTTSVKQIVKYIKIFFEGSLEVAGLGTFNFEQGRLCYPKDASQEQLGFVNNVNQLLKLKRPLADWVST